MTLNVTWVNQPPQGTSKAVTLLENQSYAFAAGDFGFSDPHDTPPDALLAVKISTLPAAGGLTDNGAAVGLGQYVPVGDINSGELVFTPAEYASGAAYASFTFQVQDNGGTANNGVDLDPLPKTMTVNVTPVGYVMGRYVVYHDSAWDGNATEAGPQDDSAIAPDKQALLPGQTASFANYTSYSKGINGIIIDLQDPGNAAAINPADFQFRVGNDSNPSDWSAAPAPSQIATWTLADGLTRVEIIWPDHDPLGLLPQPQTIAGEWLEVAVLATADTNLLQPDVFCFGNAIGETGDSTTNAYVNATDEIGARINPASYGNPASITDVYDFNRDQRVDATDEIIARDNPTAYGNALNLISFPLSAAQIQAQNVTAGPLGETGGPLTVIAGQSFSVTEHSPVGTVVGTVLATDTGAPPLVLSYAITAGNEAGVFAIDPATGQITVANMLLLDYRRLPQCDLTVQASDNGVPPQSASAVVTINLIEVPAVVTVGNLDLLPNTPDQVRQIMVSGGEYVAGLTFNISVGNGLDADAPRITGVDIIGTAAEPTIFYGNNTGQVDPNGAPGPYAEYETAQTTTNAELVPADGVLANVTFDTTGFTAGTWALVLADPGGVATDFAGVTPVINNGEITVDPSATWSFAGTTGLDSQNDMPPGMQVNGMTFSSDAGAFVLSGNSVDFGGEIVNNSLATETIALPLALTGNNCTLDAAAGNLQISGDISQGGGIVKTGAGTAVLSGTNTYAGSTTVLEGTLQVPSSDALAPGTALIVGSGAEFLFGSSLGGQPLQVASPAGGVTFASSSVSAAAVSAASGTGDHVRALRASAPVVQPGPRLDVTTVCGPENRSVQAAAPGPGPEFLGRAAAWAGLCEQRAANCPVSECSTLSGAMVDVVLLQWSSGDLETSSTSDFVVGLVDLWLNSYCY
jgi:autotransporter-associated beta strand protein